MTAPVCCETLNVGETLAGDEAVDWKEKSEPMADEEKKPPESAGAKTAPVKKKPPKHKRAASKKRWGKRR